MSSNIVQGDTYPFTHQTHIYRPEEGWAIEATVTDKNAVTIVGAMTSYSASNCLWSGVFLPADTSTLTVGSAGFTVRFKRDFTPPQATQDVRTDVRGVVLQVVDPSGMDSEQSYYIEQLRQVRACLEARLKGGVAEYTVADYSMRYLSVEDLWKLEKYYANKVADFASGMSNNGVSQVYFTNHA